MLRSWCRCRKSATRPRDRCFRCARPALRTERAGVRLRPEQSFLLVVDVQAQLAPRVAGAEQVIAKCVALMKAAHLLKLPVSLTGHCGGPIREYGAQIRVLTPPGQPLAKKQFCFRQ